MSSKVLCGDGQCIVRTEDTVLYRDDDHLTNTGAQWLAMRLPFGCL